MSFNSDVTLSIDIGWDATGPFDTSFTWTDVTSYCRSFTTKTGRGHEFDTVQAGVATFLFDNSDRRFEPEYSSGAYYPNVVPMKPIRVQAEHDSTTYNVWYGYIESYPQEWPTGKDSICRLSAVDGFKILAFWEVADSESQELSGTRVGHLLDSVGWPAGLRDIDSGAYQVQGFTPDCGGVLGEIDRVTKTEDGLFFMAPDGKATFHDANHRGGASVATFTEVGGGGLYFAHGTLDFDDHNIWNDVTVAAVGTTPQAADDATSVATYGRRKLKRFDTLHVSAANALSVAQGLRDRYKNPGYRLPALVVNPLRDGVNLWPEALGRGISDKVTVSVATPAGGATIDVDVYIEGVDHTVDARSRTWLTSWILSPVPFSPDATVSPDAATFSMSAPAVSVAVGATQSPAAATFSMSAPAATGQGSNVSVTATPAAATFSMSAPAATGSADVTPTPAAATFSMSAPAATADTGLEISKSSAANSGAGSSSSFNATFTSTPSENDLMVIVAACGSSNSVNVPSGWTNANASSESYLRILWKKAGASESTTVAMTLTGSDQYVWHTVAYSATNDWEASPVDDSGELANAGEWSSGGTSVASGTTGTTTQGDGLVVSAHRCRGGSEEAASYSANYTELVKDTAESGQAWSLTLYSAERTVTSTGTFTNTASWSSSKTGRTGNIVVFSPVD